jgi:tetratricopeptide (TPR) repeat protein
MLLKNKLISAGVYLAIILLIVPAGVSSFDDNSRESLKEYWVHQSKILQDPRSGYMAIESARQALADLLLDNGVSRSALLAAAYAAEGVQLIDGNQPDRAIWAFRSALRMDKGYLPACRGLLVASFHKSLFSVPTALVETAECAFHAWQDNWVQFVTLGNAAILFMLTMLISFFVLIITLTLKHLPLFYNDIRGLIPKTWSGYIGVVITAVIMIMPLFLGLGPIWTVLLWLVITYLYLERRDRLILWCVWIGLVFTLPANIMRVTVIKAYDEGILHAISYVERGGYSSKTIDAFDHFQKKFPGKSKMHFMKGLLYKHGGHYFDALKENLEYTRVNPSDASGHINLGNIYFVLNNLGETISEYRRGENTDPSNAAIYYNLSKAYFHQFKFQQATNMLKKASSIDSDLVTYYTEIHSTNPNRLLIDSPIPDIWFWEEVPPLLSSALADQDKFWIDLGPGLDFAGTAIMMAVITIVLLLIQLAGQQLNISRFCVMCGQPSNKRKRKGSVARICSLCEMTALKKGQIDSEDRDKRMFAMNRRTRIKSLVSFILAFLYPGAGDIYMGRIISGIFFAVIWACLLSIWFASGRLFNVFETVPAIGNKIGFIFQIVVMMCLYLASLLSVVKGQTE